MLWPNPGPGRTVTPAGRARQQDGHAILNGTAAPSSAAWADPPALPALSARLVRRRKAQPGPHALMRAGRQLPLPGAQAAPAGRQHTRRRVQHVNRHGQPVLSSLLLQGRQEGRLHHSRSSPGRRAGVRLRWGHRRADQSCCWACPPGGLACGQAVALGRRRRATCLLLSLSPSFPPDLPSEPGFSGVANSSPSPSSPGSSSPSSRRGPAAELLWGHEAADFDPPTNFFQLAWAWTTLGPLPPRQDTL